MASSLFFILYIYIIYIIYILNIYYIYIYIYIIYIYKNSYLISTTADNIIQYLHVESNHPQNIVKQIPKTIEKHLLQLSIDKEIFNESAPFYEDQVHQSGYEQKLKCNPANAKTHNKHNRRRNII